MKRNLCAVAVGLATMLAGPASASIIFEAGSATAAPGSTGNTLEIDVLNTGPDAVTIGGFNFEVSSDADIDFTVADYSTANPYIFMGDSFDQANSLPLNTTSGSSISAGDISESGNGTVVGSGDTAGLALLVFDVSPTATLGTAAVNFATDSADTNLSAADGSSIPIDGFTDGSIVVTSASTGTPEPSGLGLGVVGAMGLFALLRRAKPALSRGRDAGYPAPPAQIRAGAANAHGSYFG